MPITLQNVIPWGRSLLEYQYMFSLPEELTSLRVISLADGPASFNSELSNLGGEVISVDPIYQFSVQEIQARFDVSADNIIRQVKATPDSWVWTFHKDADHLLANRRQALKLFLADFQQHSERYLYGELPSTGIKQSDFDLALCSHFLFLYSEFFDEAFHIEAIKEMTRLANDIRIFPLLTLKQTCSPHLKPVMKHFSKAGFLCEIKQVNYELQRGGNEMLHIRHR